MSGEVPDLNWQFQTENLVDFIDQIYKSFEEDNYTLRVFIDLSEAFDTVDLSIWLKKLEIYGVNTANLAWFASYLNVGKQYMKITESADSVKKEIKCGVLQGSILGPLLFLNVLVPIMFADDTIFF